MPAQATLRNAIAIALGNAEVWISDGHINFPDLTQNHKKWVTPVHHKNLTPGGMQLKDDHSGLFQTKIIGYDLTERGIKNAHSNFETNLVIKYYAVRNIELKYFKSNPMLHFMTHIMQGKSQLKKQSGAKNKIRRDLFILGLMHHLNTLTAIPIGSSKTKWSTESAPMLNIASIVHSVLTNFNAAERSPEGLHDLYYQKKDKILSIIKNHNIIFRGVPNTFLKTNEKLTIMQNGYELSTESKKILENLMAYFTDGNCGKRQNLTDE